MHTFTQLCLCCTQHYILVLYRIMSILLLIIQALIVMHIAFLTPRLVEYDPVSEQITHWISVLSFMGHRISVLAGEVSASGLKDCSVEVLPNLSIHHPSTQWDIINAFVNPTEPPDDILFHLESFSNLLAMDLDKWMKKSKPDVLVIENCTSLPIHPALTLALFKKIDDWKIEIWAHQHDFFWDNYELFISPYEIINQLMDFQIPFKSEYIKHICINTHTQLFLGDNFGLKSSYIPYVLNFENANKRNFNRGILRNELSVHQRQKILLFPQPLAPNQGFETALEILRVLNNKDIKLVITHTSFENTDSLYFKNVLATIRTLELENQVLFAYAGINAKGMLTGPGISYTMADAYIESDAILFLPTFESSGNYILQAILHQKPMVVSNFSPSLHNDFLSKGIHLIELPDHEVTVKNILELELMLTDKVYAADIAKKNLDIARLHFSYQTLVNSFELLIE